MYLGGTKEEGVVLDLLVRPLLLLGGAIAGMLVDLMGPYSAVDLTLTWCLTIGTKGV